MAITKVTGHVIDPITNITSHNINSSGIITATRFDGPLGVGLTDGNFSGIVTTGELKANGIGVTSLNVSGVSTFSGNVQLLSTDAGSSAAPEFKLFRNSASPADADYLGQLKFAGESDTGVERNYAKITGKILDASNGTEDGILEFAHIKAGSQTITGRWRSDSLQLLNGTNFSVAGTSEFTGNATFNGNDNVVTGNYLDIQDGKKLRLGTDGDCAFYFNGSATLIETGNKIIHMQTDASIRLQKNDPQAHMLIANAGGSVDLYHSGNKKFETTSSGAKVTGNLEVTGVLTYDDVTNIDSIGIVTAREGIFLPDTKELKLGNSAASPDLKLYSTGTNGWVFTPQSGADLYMGTNAGEVYIQTGSSGNDTAIKVNSGGSVELNHSTNKKLETTSSGVTVTGDVTATGLIKTDTAGEGLHNTATNAYFFSHGSNETRLYHSANAQIKLSFRGSGDVLRGAVSADASGMHILTAGSSEQKGVRCVTDGTTELYYSGNKKLETTNGGITVTGKIFADSLDMGDNERVLLGADDDLELYHHSNNSYIKNSTNALTIQSGAVYINDVANAKTSASFDTDGSVQINHNNALKLSTSTTGISVTGEVAATQDYPDIRPALDFNFAAVKKLDPRIVYFRTGPASYTDEFGKVILVGESQPRFDHSFPEYWNNGTLGDSDSKGVSKGLLIEDARTNIFKNNHNLKTVNDHSSLSWTTNTTDTTAPDGSYSATKITGGTNGSWSRFDNNNGLDVSTINFSDTFTYSVYMKTVGTSNVDVNIDFGDVGSKLFSVGQEWKRYAISGIHHNYGNTKFIDLDPRGDIYIWGLQVEKGTFPTSYIPTRGTTVTRGGDYVGIKDIGGPDHSDFWNTEEGTYLIDYEPLEIAVGDGVIIGSKRGNNGSGYPWPLYRHDTANTNNFKSYDLTNGIVSMSTTWAYRRETWALGFNGTNGSIVRNGTQLQTNNTNMNGLIDANELWLGSSGTGSLYSMHIRRFMYYPKRVSDSQLKTLTS